MHHRDQRNDRKKCNNWKQQTKRELFFLLGLFSFVFVVRHNFLQIILYLLRKVTLSNYKRFLMISQPKKEKQ